jgi:CDGSH-type Zn-finger protein
MMTRITVRPNSHYLVEGDDVTLVDWNGNEYQIPNRRSFALCRCGGSTSKPFCDGTHSRIGFQAAESAPPRNHDQAPR